MTGKQVLAALQKRGIVRKLDIDSYEFTSPVYGSTKQDRFKQLVKDARVPYQIRSSSGGKYFATRPSVAATNALHKMLFVDFVNYETIVQVTRDYYAQGSVNLLVLSKMLSEGVIADLCAQHKDGVDTFASDETTTMV